MSLLPLHRHLRPLRDALTAASAAPAPAPANPYRVPPGATGMTVSGITCVVPATASAGDLRQMARWLTDTATAREVPRG